MKMTMRGAEDRGHLAHDLMESRYSFSYGGYYDPAYMGISVLHVINEDVIEPVQGYGRHPYRNMEIIMYMLRGAMKFPRCAD